MTQEQTPPAPKPTAAELADWVTLSETRKKDRETMGKHIQDLAGRVAPMHVLVHLLLNRRGEDDYITVEIDGPHPLYCRFDLRRSSRRDMDNVFVLSWFFRAASDNKRIAPDFAQDTNHFHGHKATDVAHGFENLMTILMDRFWKMEHGKAFVRV